MFVRTGQILMIVAMLAITGGHWVALQTVAWTTMLADNLHSASLHDALVKTFDGKHPCCLCKSIAAGKQSEQKREFTVQMQKLEFPPVREHFALIAPSQFQLVPQGDTFAESFFQKPLLQPPRRFFV